MEITQNGYIVIDSARGDDATAQRDSSLYPFATLSRAFQQIQDGDTVLIYPGSYTEQPQEPLDISNQPGGGAPLWLQDHSGIVLRGIGLPELSLSAHGCGLTIENCTDVVVEGIQFRGLGLLTEPKAYTFALLLCKGVNEGLSIRDCVFTESGDYGLGHLVGPRTTNNSVVENNRFLTGGNMNHPTLGCDGAAIALGGSGNLIYGNRIERWVRGMEFESGSFPGLDAPTARNIFSQNKVLQCWWQHLVVIPTHGQAALFDQILIEGNIIQGWGANPEQDFTENSFPHEGIYFGGGVNAQIRGNTISDMWEGIGLRMTADWCDILDVLVSENRIWNVDRAGIQAQGGQGGILAAVPRIQIAADPAAGTVKLSVSGPEAQIVRIQQRSALKSLWSNWQSVTLSANPTEVVDGGVADATQRFYRAVVDAPNPSFNVKRCRVVKNKIGPCGGRGVWINGDYNAVESNDVHLCGGAQSLEGLYLEAGDSNVLRRNRLIDCLGLTDQGTNTQAVDNDLFSETPPSAS